MERESGQATLEYVAVLALVVCVFLAGAVAVAAPELPGVVVAKVKLGLCIVGGDVCTRSQARARALDPCVVGAETHDSHHGMTIAVLHTNRGGAYTIERRSDGSVTVTRVKDWGAAGTVGVGVDVPGLSVGAEAELGASYAPGKRWELSAAEWTALTAWVNTGDYDAFDGWLDHRFPRPASTFKTFGVHSDASLLAKLNVQDFEAELVSTGIASHREVGFRDNPDGTSTVVFAVGADVSGVLGDVVPGAADSDLVAEWTTSEPPQLRLTIAGPGPDPDEREEVVAALTLSDPALREQALHAMVGSAVSGEVAWRGLADALRTSGTVQRFRYRERAAGSDTALGFKAGALNLGVDGSSNDVFRELVDAEILNGPLPSRRVDCLGVA